MARILEKYALLHTKNINKAREGIAKIHCDHVLEQADDTPLDLYCNYASLSHLAIGYIEYNTEVLINPGKLDDFFLIQLPVRGQAFVELGKEKKQSIPGVASIASPDQSLRMHWSKACQQLLIKIDRLFLERQLRALIKEPFIQPLTFDLLMPAREPAQVSWWNMVNFLINDLESGRYLHLSETGTAFLERSIVTNLLYIQPHNYSRQLLPNNSIAPGYIKRVEQYMEENVSNTITTDDLVAAAGVHARTLQTAFKQFRQTTPMNFLRNLRLKKVRGDLVNPQKGTNVTEVAIKWGFSQMGRFAENYKKAYGECPSETLRRYKNSKSC